MTDQITDAQTAFLTAFARGVAARPSSYSPDLVASARAVLATADATVPTLSEVLRHHAELASGDEELEHFTELANRAELLEQDLTAARAELAEARDELAGAEDEIDRQVKIADDLRTTAGMAQRERDALRTQLEEARMAAEGHAQDAMDAADERDQLRDELRAITTGRTFTTPDLESEIVSTLDTAIRTVLARLHVTTRRIITNPDELHQLATTSIIRDGRGWPGGVTDQGVMMINGFSVSDEEVLSHGPVTVLWEPDA